MKLLDLLNAPFRAAGIELHKRDAWRAPEDWFHEWSHLEITARRLEHIATLALPLRDKSVLEVGAGVGDLSTFFLDRGCRVTITEARESNLEYMRRRFPKSDVAFLDLDAPTDVAGGPFDVVSCFGLLYHLGRPAEALASLARQCRDLLVLETCVSFGAESAVNLVDENIKSPTQAFTGHGCRPTRPWIMETLRRDFAHVYVPRTQPNHAQFPIDWTRPEDHTAPLSRAVFIASRTPLDNAQLAAELSDRQERAA